jgi:uncharacterized phosphosugar-binding protein
MHPNTMLYRLACCVAAAVALVAIVSSCGIPEDSAESPPYIPLGDYADLYLRGSYDILHVVKVRELPKIGEACAEAARRIMAGGTIVSNIGTPHIMYSGACDETMPGNPNIAPDIKNVVNYIPGPSPQGNTDDLGGNPALRVNYQPGGPILGEGDVLIIANPNPHVQAAYENDCYVIGVGFPMTTNRHSPPDFNDFPDTPIDDMTSIFIYSWAPKEDGLITPALDRTYYLRILPTSPMTVVLYWTITAQIAYNLAHGDTSGSFEAAEAYLDTLMARLATFHRRHIADIHTAGGIMADRVLAGGRIHPWSPRDEFWIEANGTAGGLMGVYPLDTDSLTAKDVVLLAAADSTPVREIATAEKIREKGAWLLGIFPFERADGYSTAPLTDLCDMQMDNLSGDAYGVLDLPGYDHTVIPTQTLMNNFAYWAVTGAYVQEMERRGVEPYFWMSYHVPDGREYDESIRDAYLERGY